MSATFDAYYQNPNYLAYKRLLFNYLLRKNIIDKQLGVASWPALDIGSGVAPMLSGPGVILSDTSLAGMRVMRREGCVCSVLDIRRLGLKANRVKTIICSEVLEHVPDDQLALSELARVLAPGGRLIITAPLHRYYWSRDDDAVGHCRRYSPDEMRRKISRAGLRLRQVRKVGSIFERGLTIIAVFIFYLSEARGDTWAVGPGKLFTRANSAVAWLLERLAPVGPMATCSIGLFDCSKDPKA